MITWVFRVRNERDPYTRRHYGSVHWKGEKKHFCSQKERVPSLRWNIEIGFLSQRLNFRRCTQRPSPPHPSSVLQKNQKNPKKTKTTCHHPPRGIHSTLPKKEGKKRRETEKIIIIIMLLDRCDFHPERKTFVLSTCCGIRLLSCSLLLCFLLHSCHSSKEKARSKLVCSGPMPHLPRAPSGQRIAQDPRKVCERKSWRAGSQRESASPGAPAAQGRPRSAAHSLALSGQSHHGLCVLLCWRFHTPICFPVSNLQLYNKRFFFTKTVVIRPRANRMWNRRWLHAREILF